MVMAGSEAGVPRTCSPVIQTWGCGRVGSPLQQVHSRGRAVHIPSHRKKGIMHQNTQLEPDLPSSTRGCASAQPQGAPLSAPTAPLSAAGSAISVSLPCSGGADDGAQEVPSPRALSPCTADLYQPISLCVATHAGPCLPLLTGSLPCICLGAAPSAQ